MTTEEKRKILEDIQAGRVKLNDLTKKTPVFILPANDGTDNVHVITRYSNQVYTKQQIKNTKYWDHDNERLH